MPNLTEFLLERIAEDAARADLWMLEGATPFGETEYEPLRARVLAECEAKRRIVTPWVGTVTEDRSPELRALATVYADHPDYDATWARDDAGVSR